MKKYELKFWNKKVEDEGTLRNDHFKYFYTAHFGLDDASYDGKCVLDIGCGPRGSLEWANMASRRIGVDPLVSEYLRLGADQHQMEYIEAPSESIPLDRAECDIVCAFNCFDHFIDIERSIAEVKRVTRPGGLFLLLVEVNQPESKYCPHGLTPELVHRFEPEFDCELMTLHRPVTWGMYESIRQSEAVPSPRESAERGYLSLKLRRLDD